MSREIKFRVWHKPSNKFITDWVWGVDRPRLNLTLLGEVIANSEGYGNEVIKNCIVQQYTGLKDKGGKGIYEGDILYNPDDNMHYEIKFVSGAFVVSHKQHNTVLCDYTVDSLVVGNIMENPELLNK